MKPFGSVARLVEKEMNFWGKPIVSMIVGTIPIIMLDPIFDGPPSAAPPQFFYPALGITAIWEALVAWLYVKFEFKEWQKLRALGAAEEEAAKRKG